MEKKEVKVGNKFIPIEAGGVIPMTEEEWNDFQKQMKVERDYFYMVGNKKYVHYENEDYVRVSDIQQELDKAREEQFTQQELKRIEELLGFMLSDYPSSFWKPEDKSIEKKISKLKQ